MEILSPRGVLVRDTGTSKGRGVFATRAYASGELVESCPAVPFTGTFSQIPSEIRQLLFHWKFTPEGRNVHCLALGYGSLYNHASPSNMTYEPMIEARVLRFTAARDIARGEELTADYNARSEGPSTELGDWFSRMGIERLGD